MPFFPCIIGGHISANLPGGMPTKPGSCALPYYGIEFAVLDPVSGKEMEGNDVEGVSGIDDIHI